MCYILLFQLLLTFSIVDVCKKLADEFLGVDSMPAQGRIFLNFYSHVIVCTAMPGTQPKVMLKEDICTPSGVSRAVVSKKEPLQFAWFAFTDAKDATFLTSMLWP